MKGSTHNSVIAIGLDSADPFLLETWMDQGHLKHLKQLRQQGCYTRLNNLDYYRAETPWTTFLTGCSPQKTGYWSPVKMTEGTYEVKEIQAYDFTQYLPFYALDKERHVAVFDMPQSILCEEGNGLQVLAWGAHSPMTPSHSYPASLLKELIQQHGQHPTLRRDYASCYNVPALMRLQHGLKRGIARRAKICRDLLQRQPWDLFLTVFGETHSAGHYLWHLSQPSHPLFSHYRQEVSGDPMLEVFQAVDQAIADILEAAPEDAQVVVFSAHGMGDNVMDLPSMVFLPELMYRFSFPGKVAIAPGRAGVRVPPPIMTGRVERGWVGAVWGLKKDPNPLRRYLRQTLPNRVFRHIEPWFGESQEMDLISPFQLQAENDSLYFQPPLWYKPFWSQMQAFALPSYSEGYIRINLKGREPEGIVEPEDYDTVCGDLTHLLYDLRDARSGKPMVQNVIRTRQSVGDRNPKLPDADLVVIWQEDIATDTVDTTLLGRIGPIPHCRTGSHRARGFLIAKGEGIEPNSTLPNGHALDLAPTLLQLMGIEIPAYMEGKSLLHSPTLRPEVLQNLQASSDPVSLGVSVRT